MKADPAYLVDRDTAAGQVAVYVAGLTFDQFRDNSMVHDAVLYNFAVCGEAVRHLSEEFRDTHPEIEWDRIVAFRNRVTHDYANLDLQIVWRIATEEVPILRSQLAPLLPKPPPDA